MTRHTPNGKGSYWDQLFGSLASPFFKRALLETLLRAFT